MVHSLLCSAKAHLPPEPRPSPGAPGLQLCLPGEGLRAPTLAVGGLSLLPPTPWSTLFLHQPLGPWSLSGHLLPAWCPLPVASTFPKLCW